MADTLTREDLDALVNGDKQLCKRLDDYDVDHTVLREAAAAIRRLSGELDTAQQDLALLGPVCTPLASTVDRGEAFTQLPATEYEGLISRLKKARELLNEAIAEFENQWGAIPPLSQR